MSRKLRLPDVTLLGIDCLDVTRLIDIACFLSRRVRFGAIKILSSIPSCHRWVKKIDPIHSIEEYSRFTMHELDDFVHTSHVLIFQHDGFILNPEAWMDEFLQFDYIGAPWHFPDGNNVGNGGFCLRSKKLLRILKSSAPHEVCHPEDVVIARALYDSLNRQGVRFAPKHVAAQFSFEGRTNIHDRWNGQFGFHSYAVTDIGAWNLDDYTRSFRDRRFRERHQRHLTAYQDSLVKWKCVPADYARP